MSGIEIALIIPYSAFIIGGIYTLGIKQELNEYRSNEEAKKRIAEASTLDGRLIRNSNAVHTFK